MVLIVEKRERSPQAGQLNPDVVRVEVGVERDVLELLDLFFRTLVRLVQLEDG